MEIKKYSLSCQKQNITFSIQSFNPDNGQVIASPEFEINQTNYDKSKWQVCASF